MAFQSPNMRPPASAASNCQPVPRPSVSTTVTFPPSSSGGISTRSAMHHFVRQRSASPRGDSRKRYRSITVCTCERIVLHNGVLESPRRVHHRHRAVALRIHLRQPARLVPAPREQSRSGTKPLRTPPPPVQSRERGRRHARWSEAAGCWSFSLARAGAGRGKARGLEKTLVGMGGAIKNHQE